MGKINGTNSNLQRKPVLLRGQGMANLWSTRVVGIQDSDRGNLQDWSQEIEKLSRAQQR
jgi:hypothetical protein